MEIGAGIPVLLWTRKGYSDRSIRCTRTTFRGALNRMHSEFGDLLGRDNPQ